MASKDTAADKSKAKKKIPSAAKRARQSEERRARNNAVKSALKTHQKKLRTLLQDGKKDEARQRFREFSSAMDRAAKRGVIHPNAVHRRKRVYSRALAS